VEIRELRAFSAVAEEGSVSAAGRKLHLSQSAVSQTIQSLERQLGVQLLIRGAGGATLTGAGAVLLREARTLIAQHDRALAAVAGQAAASATLRVGVPLEFPADLLPRALAEMGAGFPRSQVDIRHAPSSAQLSAMEAGELDLALVRERPADPDYDAVLAVEEALGVILAADRAAELAGPTGVRLHQLAGLDWVAFARSEAPSWHDQVTATLSSHGVIRLGPGSEGGAGGAGGAHPLIAEVKLAAVAAGHAFALAPPGWSGSPPLRTLPAGCLPGDPAALPGGVTWSPLIGNPLVRRTWAVWPAASTRRDLAALVAALDVTAR
jgi:molybdate transport repressor ModE-like protein